MRTVLFVDDDPSILTAQRRALRDMRRQWDMAFAESAAQAIELMTASSFDVVVTDVRMPGMDGVELLKHVRHHFPATVRIILSGHSDYDKALESTLVAHQYLAKPTTNEQLRAAVERSLTLQELLGNDTLQAMITGQGHLPSPPMLYTQIMQQIESPSSDLAQIGSLIARDVSMSAKILQLVNSAFFGLPRQITDVGDAITLLGLNTIRGLMLYSAAFSTSGDDGDVSFIERLQTHSSRVAELAGRIIRHHGGNREQQALAQTAGMLHDIGHLAMLATIPAQSAGIRMAAEAQGIPAWKQEQQSLGCTHAELGAYLLGLWGLPMPLVEAVAHHHQPGRLPVPEFSIVSAVHIANALAHSGCPGSSGDFRHLLDIGHIESIGQVDSIENWCRLSGE